MMTEWRLYLPSPLGNFVRMTLKYDAHLSD